MSRQHPDADLTALAAGELTGAERESVMEHLTRCERCRETVAASRAVLRDLAASRPDPPTVHWGRYRSDLRRRIGERLSTAAAGGADGHAPRAWWARAAPVALSGALAGLLVLIAMHGLPRRPVEEAIAIDDALLARRLEVIRQSPLLEQLDLFEDLEVIRQLDGLTTPSEG